MVASTLFLFAPNARAATFVQHGYILINGNSGFTSANGVTGGSGTASDPYLIQGWSINLCWKCYPAYYGIKVANTTATFRIFNVSVSSPTQGQPGYGIVLENVTNGRIDSSVVDVESIFNGPGITVASSRNVVVNANNVAAGGCSNFSNCSTYDSVGVYSSTNVTVSGNSVKAYAPGSVLGVKGSSNVTIVHNTIFMNGYAQIGAPYASSNGITVSSSGNLIISQNSLVNNACAKSIIIGGSSNAQIFENNITNTASSSACGSGIVLQSATGTLVYHNNFVNFSVQASDDNPGKNQWDNGYPSGGNYWSTYAGVDNCRGPQQNICPSPDGIGDTSFSISGGVSVDRYPLMKPFVASTDPSLTVNSTVSFQGVIVSANGSISVAPSDVVGTVSVTATNSTTGAVIFSKTYSVDQQSSSGGTSFLLNVAVSPYPLSLEVTLGDTGGLWGSTMTITRQMDFMGRGSVDIVDLATMAMHYGSSMGSAGYYPRADLDGSGTIDIIDLGTAAAYYGAEAYT